MTAATGNVNEMNKRKEETREVGGGGAEMRLYIALLLIDSVKSCRDLGLMMCVCVCVHACVRESVLFRAYCTPGISNSKTALYLKKCKPPASILTLYCYFHFLAFLSGCKKMRRYRKQEGVLY